MLGREFPYDILQAISSQDEETLQAGLDQLVEAELLYQRGRPPRARYVFKHALIQDAAYASLLRNTRQQTHQKIAQILVAKFPHLVETQPETLAHHATEGCLYDQAVVHWRRAGQQASAHSANQEAVACFEQALQALQDVSECRDTREQGIDLRLDLRNALLPLAEHGRIFDTLREAERLCTTLNDQPRLGRVLSYLARYFIGVGDHDRAVEFGQRALSIAVGLGEFSLQIVANFYLGAAYSHMGNYRLAKDALGRIMLPPEDERSRERFGLPYLPSVFARGFLVRSLAELGEFAMGYTLAEEGMRIAEAIDQPWDCVVADFSVGELCLRQGKYQEAISMLERALSRCQSANISEWLGTTAAKLVSAYAMSGCVAESLSVLEQDVKQRALGGKIGRLSDLTRSLGEAYLLEGRVQDAIVHAERSLDLARTHKERGYEAWSLLLLGDIARHNAPIDPEHAETHYQQALTLATELGMRPLQAHCHRGLGTLYSQAGPVEQARAELSTAIEMYREMEMTFWLPETEAALAEVEKR